MKKSQLIFVLSLYLFMCFGVYGDSVYVDSLTPQEAEQEAILLRKAEDGTPQDKFNLARFYEQTGQDYQKILLWLRRAGKEGSLEAQFALGKIYHFGTDDILPDLKKAAYWYDLAGQQGDRQAIAHLEEIRLKQAYKMDATPSLDEMMNMQWIIKTANYGDRQSQFELGQFYRIGKKVPMNYSLAVQWYEKSARQGHIEAMFYLAGLYLSGKGVPADIEKAIYWYEKSAKENYLPSQRKLYEIYSNGKNHLPDLVKASGWLYISLKPLFPNETQLTKVSPELEQLFLQMTPKQLDEALSFAYSFLEEQEQK